MNRDDFLRGIVMSLRADGGSIGHTTNISVAAVRPMAYDATEYPLLSSLLFDLDIWTTERREGWRVGGRYAVHLCRVTLEKRPRAAITMYARDASHDYTCGDFGAAQTRTYDVIDS